MPLFTQKNSTFLYRTQKANIFYQIQQDQDQQQTQSYNQYFGHLMIIHMDPQECDSIDQEDIDFQQNQLLKLPGPTLHQFSGIHSHQHIVSLAFINSLKSSLPHENYDIKFVGNNQDSQYKAFCYILLALGADQSKQYPHLNTLIREQFYKPDIFKISNQNQTQVEEMLEKCLQYFEQINNGSIRVQEYLLREYLFEQACVSMLKNSVQIDNQMSLIEQLATKFNIDLQVVKAEKDSECYILGNNKHFYILRERDFFLLAISKSNQVDHDQKIDNESFQSQYETPPIVEASDGSTPQFMNSEAKYPKKSHKDSFGGDLQLQYGEIFQFQGQRRNTKNKVQILSDYYDQNEVESCAQHTEQKTMNRVIKKNSFQDIIDGQKAEMKLSTIQPSNQLLSNFQLRQNRKISSSEIIEYRPSSQISHIVKQEPVSQNQLQDKGHAINPNSSNNSILVKEQPSHPQMTASKLIALKQLQRIQERQSSQRDSTHPDQSSEAVSQGQVQVIDGEQQSQVKIKDRKDSYFTQQMASTRVKIHKQIDSRNYIFKLPKNVHKNSQMIVSTGLEDNLIKRRFQQNPLSFSQSRSPSHDNLYQSQQPTQPKKIKPRTNLRLNQSLYSYQIKFEPEYWYKKQVIYYLPDHKRQILVFQKSYPNTKASPTIINAVTSDKNQSRLSYGSNRTILSNVQMKQSCNLINQTRSPSQILYEPSPFQISNSRNQIKSMINIPKMPPKLIQHTQRVNNSASHSLNKPKISFNYSNFNNNQDSRRIISNSSYIAQDSKSNSSIISQSNSVLVNLPMKINNIVHLASPYKQTLEPTYNDNKQSINVCKR